MDGSLHLDIASEPQETLGTRGLLCGLTIALGMWSVIGLLAFWALH